MTSDCVQTAPLFRSFWMGGFESACHINRKGRRLDMLAGTQHDRFIEQDYAQLLPFDIRTVRDTARWHLIEQRPGTYDFSSLDPQLNAARRHGVQVIWDLCHYGWPDGLDIFSAEFVDRFAAFSRAAAWHLRVKGHQVALPNARGRRHAFGSHVLFPSRGVLQSDRPTYLLGRAS